MADMLSQAEINALFGGGSSDDADTADDSAVDVNAYVSQSINRENTLTDEQKDILGEIGNISMGTAATTLFALLNHKVWITTPRVKIISWQELSNSYERPCVGIRVDYKEGLEGSNILILKDIDVKIIASLMMGGSGEIEEPVELTDLDLSAIGESMNQMVGSSSTSLSSMIQRKIDIDTPQPFLLDFNDDSFFQKIGCRPDDIIVSISFKMEIGNLINSEIMQVLPIDFAADLVEKLKNDLMGGNTTPMPEKSISPPPAPAKDVPMPPPVQANETPVSAAGPAQQPYPQSPYPQQQPGQPQANPQYQNPQPDMQAGYQYAAPPQMNPYYQTPELRPGFTQNVNAQPVQFQNFDVTDIMRQKENIDIIMDVPLEITVELGRTKEKIMNILEFSPGTIVPLDKIAGEPIDVLVNGKHIAKGDVVVIDESFAVRITDIISADKRI